MSTAEHEYGKSVEDFKPGQLVELCPGCDRWMMGDRFGAVVGVKDNSVRVRLHRSGKTLPFPPDRLRHTRYTS